MKNYFYLMILILSISCSKDAAEVSDPKSFESFICNTLGCIGVTKKVL